jgi:hypothetical protein
VRAAARLARRGIPFGFIFTLTFHNVHELDWVAQFAVEQGARCFNSIPSSRSAGPPARSTVRCPTARKTRRHCSKAVRIRELYKDMIDVQIDLATIPALLDHPTRVFVRERDGVRRADRCGCRRSPGGRNQRTGFAAAIRISTRLVMGQHQGQRACRKLAASWLSRDYAAFLILCRSVYEQSGDQRR